jgi:cytoskeletal protein RodZ
LENLGQYLKKQREAQGLDYFMVYTDIRLKEEQVKLIEDNRFFELGPHGMVRSIVYNYARYLGADLTEVKKELEILIPEVSHKLQLPQEDKKEKKIMLSTNLLWGLGIAVFVVILGMIVYHAYINGWLTPPPILKQGSDSLKTSTVVPDEEIPLPDSSRLKMLELTEELNKKPKPDDEDKDGKRTRPKKTDNTDYIKTFMEDSPVNRE